MNGYNFTITAEECRQLEKERLVCDVLYFLHHAGRLVGYQTTIDDAIRKLTDETRFKDELEERINNEIYPLSSQLTK